MIKETQRNIKKFDLGFYFRFEFMNGQRLLLYSSHFSHYTYINIIQDFLSPLCRMMNCDRIFNRPILCISREPFLHLVLWIFNKGQGTLPFVKSVTIHRGPSSLLRWGLWFSLTKCPCLYMIHSSFLSILIIIFSHSIANESFLHLSRQYLNL